MGGCGQVGDMFDRRIDVSLELIDNEAVVAFENLVSNMYEFDGRHLLSPSTQSEDAPSGQSARPRLPER